LAAVVSRDNEYLLCRRPAHKRHGNLWEFPGGKLEKGETYHQAAQRELAEELGVTTVSVSDVIFSTKDAGSEFQIDFVRTTILGDPICIEHSALNWVATEDLLALELAPSDRRFAEFLQSAGAKADGQ
jgi:8-oxo-dGTP diphosphatase